MASQQDGGWERGDGTLHATGDSSTPRHTLSCFYSVYILGVTSSIARPSFRKDFHHKGASYFQCHQHPRSMPSGFGSNHYLSGYAGGVEAKVALPKIVKQKLKTGFMVATSDNQVS